MKKLVFLILTFLLVLSCKGVNYASLGASQVELNYHADPTFTVTERRQLEAAADMWYRQTGGLAVVTFTYDLDKSKVDEEGNYKQLPYLERKTSQDLDVMLIDIMAGCKDPTGCVLGWSDLNFHMHPDTDAPGTVLVADRAYKTSHGLTAVAAHEFGHAFGLQHRKDEAYSLMYPYDNEKQVACLTQPDLAEFCRVNRCGQVVMQPCEWK